MGRIGRPAAIDNERLHVLRAILRERRGATMQERCVELRRRTGSAVTTVTPRNTLRREGLQRIKARQKAAAAPARRYGYRARHRAVAEAGGYASSLTDAEWALAADLFELPHSAVTDFASLRGLCLRPRAARQTSAAPT